MSRVVYLGHDTAYQQGTWHGRLGRIAGWFANTQASWTDYDAVGFTVSNNATGVINWGNGAELVNLQSVTDAGSRTRVPWNNAAGDLIIDITAPDSNWYHIATYWRDNDNGRVVTADIRDPVADVPLGGFSRSSTGSGVWMYGAFRGAVRIRGVKLGSNPTPCLGVLIDPYTPHRIGLSSGTPYPAPIA